MAAGLTVRAERDRRSFRAFLCERLAAESGGRRGGGRAGDRRPDHARRRRPRPLYDASERLAPFGPGNPEPLFALADVRAEQVTPMNGGHLRCPSSTARRAAQAPSPGARRHRARRRLLAGGGSLHAVGRLKPDDWNGRKGVELEIEDARRPAHELSYRALLRGGLHRSRAKADISRLPRRRALRLSVRTSDFQSGKRGSTPLGPTTSSFPQATSRCRGMDAAGFGEFVSV